MSHRLSLKQCIATLWDITENNTKIFKRFTQNTGYKSALGKWAILAAFLPCFTRLACNELCLLVFLTSICFSSHVPVHQFTVIYKIRLLFFLVVR